MKGTVRTTQADPHTDKVKVFLHPKDGSIFKAREGQLL